MGHGRPLVVGQVGEQVAGGCMSNPSGFLPSLAIGILMR